MNPILKTAVGNHENQDRGAIINCDDGWVLVIADGVGGLSGGTEAAEMAIEFVRQHVEHLGNPAACSTLLRRMDEHISRDAHAGETTCALAVITKTQIIGASVGDSGVWMITAKTFVDLTHDQMRKPFIGSWNARPHEFAHERTAGAKLLLATDGLLKYAGAEGIVKVCREADNETGATRLIELVRYPSRALPDDVTVILATL